VNWLCTKRRPWRERRLRCSLCRPRCMKVCFPTWGQTARQVAARWERTRVRSRRARSPRQSYPIFLRLRSWSQLGLPAMPDTLRGGSRQPRRLTVVLPPTTTRWQPSLRAPPRRQRRVSQRAEQGGHRFSSRFLLPEARRNCRVQRGYAWLQTPPVSVQMRRFSANAKVDQRLTRMSSDRRQRDGPRRAVADAEIPR
jgi:hypothetical protein